MFFYNGKAVHVIREVFICQGQHDRRRKQQNRHFHSFKDYNSCMKQFCNSYPRMSYVELYIEEEGQAYFPYSLDMFVRYR